MDDLRKAIQDFQLYCDGFNRRMEHVFIRNAEIKSKLEKTKQDLLKLKEEMSNDQTNS